MNWMQALVLGIVEGITEFLPVSSTGHLLLMNRWLGVEGAFADTFAIAIQSGAMLAVVLATWRDWFKWPLLTRVLAGFLPTALAGLVLYPFVKQLFSSPMVIVVALIVGAVAMVVGERYAKARIPVKVDRLESLTHAQAATVGALQIFAMVPGVSRSASTIVGGLLLGFSRELIVRYSFLLAVPTIAAATVLDVWRQRALFTMDSVGVLLIGAATSALVAGAVIRWFLRYVRTHSFTIFAVERVIVALLAWWFLVR